MKKRSIVTTISAVILAMLLAGCSGGNKPSSSVSSETTASESSGSEPVTEVTLVDFSDKSETVELGSTYSLPNVASDTNGNDYQVVYKAVDESGNAVALNKFTFEANKVGKFIITATVTLNDGKTVSRTITLTVKDTVKPAVSFGRIKPGYVGISYKLPEVSVEDASNDCQVAVKVFLNDNEIETQNGYFTPTAAGTHQIKAIATDPSGNEGVATADIIVKAEKDPALPTEVIDFADEDVSCVRKGDRVHDYSFEILDEYQGEQDVLKVSTKDDCTTIVLNQMAHERSHYADYDDVVFRMFIPSDKRVHHMQMNNESSVARYYDLDGQASQIVYDEWHDYRFEASALLNEGANNPNLFLYSYEFKEGELYIADISVEVVAKLEIATPQNGSVGVEYTLPDITTSDFVGTPTVVTKVYLLGEDGERTEVTVTDGKFTPETAGQYTIVVTASDESGNSVTKSAEFTVTENVDVIRDNEVVDFDEKSDLNLVSDGGRFAGRNELTWLESYEGETGVLKLHTMDDQGRLQINQMAHEKSHYATYQYVVFNMFIDLGEKDAYHHAWMNNVEGESYKHDGSSLGALVYGEWIELAFPIARLTETDAPYITFYNEYFEKWADIYFSDIRVTNAKPPVTRRADEVLGFDKEKDLLKVDDGERLEGRNELTWLESYQGEYGVLKLHTMDDLGRFRLNSFIHEKDHYADYDKVVFRMYIDLGEKPAFHHVWMNNVEGESYRADGTSLGALVYGEWTEMSFPIARLTETDAPYINFYNEYFEKWADIYVSDIRVERLPTDPAREDEVIDFNEEVDLLSVSDGGRFEGRNELSWVDSYQGETGVLKLHTMDDQSRLQINQLAHEKAHYESYKYIVFRTYIDLGQKPSYNHAWMNSIEGESYKADGTSLGQLHFGKWVDLAYPIARLTETNAPYITFYNEHFEKWADIYFSDVRVTNEKPALVVRFDEVIDFNEEADVNTISDGGRPEGRNVYSWVESYEGETGVLKLHTMDDLAKIQFSKFTFEKSHYESYSYVVIRMYIDLGEKPAFNHVWMNNIEGESYRADGTSLGELAYGQWVDMAFPVARLTETDTPSISFYNEHFEKWADIYVSDVRVTTEKPAFVVA